MITSTIRVRLLSGFGVVLAVVAFGALVGLSELRQAERARLAVATGYEVVVALERAQAVLSQGSRLKQSVVETPEGARTVMEDSVVDALAERLVRLANLLGGDVGQQARLAAVSQELWRLREAVSLGANPAERDQQIDGLRSALAEMERIQLDNLTRRRGELALRHHQVLYLTGGLLAVGGFLGLIVAVVTSQRLTGPLVQLARLMQRLANHDLSIEVPHRKRGDEVGAIANALEVFKGMAQETSRHGWVKAAVAKVMVRVQAASEAITFSEILLDELMPRFGATLGAFYQTLPGRDGLARRVVRGQLNPQREIIRYTLGNRTVQAATAGRVQILSPPPADYERIAADPAAPMPATVVLLPLISGAQLLALVELGSDAPMDSRHQELLGELSAVLGLAFDNLLRGVQTRQLLQETRAQSERLRASEIELKHANEALSEKEEIARHRATHDGLTGLPNRSLFLDRLDSALLRTRRTREAAALMYLDLDGFKAVNDGLGHVAGDALLVAVAGRLRERLRGADTVARLGGDEFAILMESATRASAETIATQICESIRRPFEIALEGQPVMQVQVGTSIGIAILGAEGDDADRLIRAADGAMYAAKRSGKNRWVLAEAEANEASAGTALPRS